MIEFERNPRGASGVILCHPVPATHLRTDPMANETVNMEAVA